MSSVGLDYLNIGSTVSITTCLKEEFVGEVVALDSNARVVLLSKWPLVCRNETTFLWKKWRHFCRPKLQRFSVLILRETHDSSLRKSGFAMAFVSHV